MRYFLIGSALGIAALLWLWINAEKDETRAIEECNTAQLEAALQAEKAARNFERAAWEQLRLDYEARLSASRAEIDEAVQSYLVTLERLGDANEQLEILRQRPDDPANAPVDESLRLRAYEGSDEE